MFQVKKRKFADIKKSLSNWKPNVQNENPLFPSKVNSFKQTNEINLTHLTLSTHHFVLYCQFQKDSVFEFYPLTQTGGGLIEIPPNSPLNLHYSQAQLQSLPSFVLSARLFLPCRGLKICFSFDGLYGIIYNNKQFKLFGSDGRFLMKVPIKGYGIATTISFVEDFILVLIEHYSHNEKYIYTMDGIIYQHYNTRSNTSRSLSSIEWNVQFNTSTKQIETWNNFWIQRNTICSSTERISQQVFPCSFVRESNRTIIESNVMEIQDKNSQKMDFSANQTILRLCNRNTLLVGLSTKNFTNNEYFHRVKKYYLHFLNLNLECEWNLGSTSTYCEIVDFAISEKYLFVIFYNNQNSQFSQYTFCYYPLPLSRETTKKQIL